MKRKAMMLAGALACWALGANATTIHVPGDAMTVETGLGQASAGDTVLVAAGTYDEWGLTLPSGVTLRGATGDPADVIIDANGYDRVIWANETEAGTRLEGITFTGGSFTAGAGLYFWHATADVTDCVIRGNDSGNVGGGCFFRYSDCYVAFNRCRFENNTSVNEGGGLFIDNAAAVSLTDCTLTGNTAAEGGALYCYYATAHISQCTIAGNSASGYCGGVVSASGEVILYRDIIVDSVDGSGIFSFSSGTISIACCNIHGNADGDYVSDFAEDLGVDANISADPEFCGVAGSGNYYLQSDSPCAPSQSGCGERMGAWVVGCAETAAESTTWGVVKSLY